MRLRGKTHALLGLGALTACGGDPAAIEELRQGQRAILAKLEALEKSVQQIRTAPAAARPQIDPNKFYDIPVGRSVVKGPRGAQVSIVEFSDFQ